MYDYEGWTLMSRLIKDHHLWTRDTIKNVSGDVTLDIAGDITLDAGADVNIPASIGLTFGDDGEKIEGDGTDLTITSSRHLALTTGTDAGSIFLDSGTGIVNFRDEQDVDDLFRITVTKDTGATTLETISAGADGHLTIAPDGDLQITPTGSVKIGVDDTGYDVKFFGASAGAYMEWDQSEDQLRIMGASADATTSTGKLLLATSLTDINANDVIGKIEFQAPHEAGGTDAITVAAGIEAVAQGTFAADLNATDIIFKTGHSEAATEKFRMTSQGEIGIGGANYGTDGQVLTSAGAGVACAWEDAGGGGGSTTLKHYMDWFYYGANLATQNAFYMEKWNDEYGVSNSINTDLSSSGYSTTTLNNAWRMIRFARRVPYAGTITKFMANLEGSGAAADSDIEVALWWADAVADDTEHTSTSNFTCDHLCTLTFDFSSASRFMSKQTTSFNATAISEGDWLFVTLRKITSGDGSSFHCYSHVLWDGA